MTATGCDPRSIDWRSGTWSFRGSSSIAGEPEFIFKHILTREVAYESLPRRERASAHAAVASWIEETAGTRAKEFVELLAYHCLEAYLGARDDGLATQEVEDLRRRAFDALLGVTGEAHRRFAIAKATSAIEQALRIASGPLERIAALEWMGMIARSDYRGDLSWSAFKEAVDLRREHTPDDRRAIAWACVNGLENPLRWPGSMKTFPAVGEVKRYLAICADHVGDERSEEGIRLLTARAFQPFGFGPRSHVGPAEREDAIADGLRAAELARDLGRLDLESAALDGAGSAIVTLGHYGRLRDMLARRLEIAEQIEDPWEAGDAYAMIAWNGAMLGDFEDSARWGLLGRDRAEHEAAGIVDHCLNWAGTSLFQLGEWDRSLEVFREAQALLGERSEDPPYFMTSLFGVAAFVHDARGLPGAGGLLEILGGIRGSVLDVSTMAARWLAWVMARRGQVDRGLGTGPRYAGEIRNLPAVPRSGLRRAPGLEPSLGGGTGVRRKQPIVCDRGGSAGSARASRSARGAIGDRVRKAGAGAAGARGRPRGVRPPGRRVGAGAGPTSTWRTRFRGPVGSRRPEPRSMRPPPTSSARAPSSSSIGCVRSATDWAEAQPCMNCRTGVPSLSFIDIERPLTSKEPTSASSWR